MTDDRPETTREKQLEDALRRLRTFAGLIVNKVGINPDECIVQVNAAGPTGTRTLAQISLAECFAEADRLAPGTAT